MYLECCQRVVSNNSKSNIFWHQIMLLYLFYIFYNKFKTSNKINS